MHFEGYCKTYILISLSHSRLTALPGSRRLCSDFRSLSASRHEKQIL